MTTCRLTQLTTIQCASVTTYLANIIITYSRCIPQVGSSQAEVLSERADVFCQLQFRLLIHAHYLAHD
jgi:hypothetical protein